MRLALPLILALAACTSNQFESEMMRRVRTLSNAPSEVPARYRALSEAEAPAMVASVEKRGTAAAFRLTGARKEFETWLGNDGVTLTITGGLLVETRGLGGDVMASDVSGSLALVHADRAGQTRRTMSLLGGDDHVATLLFDCEITPRGARTIEWGGQRIETRLVAEFCATEGAKFTNLYWLSSGRIVQSRQWAGPFTEMIALREVTP